MVALSHTRQEIVVSFRGSANSWNLVLDFALLMNVRPNDTSNIKVHTGFYIATMSLYERVSYYHETNGCTAFCKLTFFNKGGPGSSSLSTKLFELQNCYHWFELGCNYGKINILFPQR